jgi:FkbH-like protein
MSASNPPLTVAIAGTFSAGPIEPALAFWMDELDIPASVEFAAYNQPFQELLDPTSLLSSNKHGVNVVLLRLEDWLPAEPGAHRADTQEARWRLDLVQNVDDFVAALAAAIRRSVVSWLLVACPASPRVNANSEQSVFFTKMENRLVDGLSGIAGIQIVSSAALMSAYPVPEYFDEHLQVAAHVPYTSQLFSALGIMVARRIYGLTQPGYKAIVVDCDNTLWTGVCGEDGPCGVEIDSGRQQVQAFLAELHDRGFLLCLCSRNNEADVRAVFEHRPEMRVGLRHFASLRINWKPKSENIMAIAAELNVSADAFVFLDDDAVECAEVQANRPDVLAIQLPGDAAAAAQFLRNLWAFNGSTTTAEARGRTEFFRQNATRERVRQEAPTLSEFLGRLGLRIQVIDATQHDHARLSELTYRTNQFNLTTIRRSEAEIDGLIRQGMECRAVRVEDRFGDYGIVGLLLFTATPEALVTDSFLLSCRALGRGIEHRMLATLGQMARRRGLSRVDLLFRPSGKNQPALDFLRSVAAAFEESQETGSVFRLPVNVAAEARYRPIEHDAATREIQRRAGHPELPRSDARAKAALLVSIARDLSDPVQVEEHISARTGTRPDTGSVYLAPRTPGERAIAAIFAAMLGIDRVGVDDNFFQLGGHSLLAMRVLFKIQEAFNVEMSARDLYDGAFTAARLATKVMHLRLRTADSMRIGEVLDRLNTLSDEEVRTLLASATDIKGRAPER